MKIFEVKNHAPSLLPDGFDFRLVWSDEFDGDTLDESKWDYRLCMMGKRHPAWTDQGVRIENSCAVFTIFEENGEIVSSQLQTGYNFMDAPVRRRRSEATICNGISASSEKTNSHTATVITNVIANCSSFPAGGRRSGCNHPSSAHRLIPS